MGQQNKRIGMFYRMEMECTQGDEAKVALQGDATAGYIWELKGQGSSGIVTQKYSRYRPPRTSNDMGEYNFYFDCSNPGTTVLNFWYRSRMQQNPSSRARVRFTVNPAAVESYLTETYYTYGKNKHKKRKY